MALFFSKQIPELQFRRVECKNYLQFFYYIWIDDICSTHTFLLQLFCKVLLSNQQSWSVVIYLLAK